MEKKHIITIGGLPGSGKSTVRLLLAEQLGYESFSTGNFTRKLATERGMSLEEFNEQIADDKSIDLLIDAELERIEREADRMVVDSHLAFHFVPSSFKVYLDIPPEQSARRIFSDREAAIRVSSGDVMRSIEDARVRTMKRIDNHRERYMRHYGVDPYDPSQFDLILNTEHTTPEEIAEAITTAYQTWLTE